MCPTSELLYISLCFPLMISYLTNFISSSWICSCSLDSVELLFSTSLPWANLVTKYTLYLFLIDLMNSTISVFKVYSVDSTRELLSALLLGLVSIRRSRAETLIFLRFLSLILTWFELACCYCAYCY